jgi:hypothetical protein
LLLSLIVLFIYPATLALGIIGTALAVTVSIMIQYLVSLKILAKTVDASFRSIATVFWKPVCYSVITFGLIYMLKNYFEIKSLPALFTIIAVSIFIYGGLNLKEIRNLLKNRGHSFA